MTQRQSVWFVAFAAGIVPIVVFAGQRAPAGQTTPTIPLCPGLTIVTAVSQKSGDYESIKTIESVTDSAVRLKYSSEAPDDDLLSDNPGKMVRITVHRTVRRSDLESATLYEQQFSTELPETIPETTAIGTSTVVLNALKTKGESELGVFIGFSQKKPSLDRNVHPNVYDNQMLASITRVGKSPVTVRVIVNDVPIDLPAIQAEGDFFGDKAEFLFLDDPKNPITLKFRFGIGGIDAIEPDEAKALGIEPKPAQDKDVLEVVKISTRCGEPAQTSNTPGGGAAGAGGAGGAGSGAGAGAGAGGSGAAASGIEKALAETGHADIYSIYFSFNSDSIRDESEPTLKDIAEVLRRHPDWKLAVNGHTDGVGADQYNLDLSKRRAAAVRQALVSRYTIGGPRLTTAGFGKLQPKDTNDTLEGRAHNRRVELVKLP